MTTTHYNTIILGAGAAGLMCAATAGQRGRHVLVLDHAEKLCEKIRISGGGRCNFTNLYTSPKNYISQNPHFCKSALTRYTQHDFINLVKKHGIAFHEKTLGQLFCDNSAKDIIAMLFNECAQGNVVVQNNTHVQIVEKTADGHFALATSQGNYVCQNLVVATGGPAIPKIGATPFGYQLAQQFGLNIVPPRAGLVPLTLDEHTLAQTLPLAGVAAPVRVSSQCGQSFDEAMLFTHRGLSGPAMLQISSYWQVGQEIAINFAPHMPLLPWLKTQRQAQPKNKLPDVLAQLLPKRLAHLLADNIGPMPHMGDLSDKKLADVAQYLENWCIKPHGTEGYKTAEVALGGVDTAELSSKTFESTKVKGLYFIGEVLDVTGHLGGFNFQWAWSSGWCAGQYV